MLFVELIAILEYPWVFVKGIIDEILRYNSQKNILNLK